MKRKFEEYLSDFLNEAEKDFRSNNDNDVLEWSLNKIQIDWNNDSSVQIYQSYLYAIINATKEDRHLLKEKIGSQPVEYNTISIIHTLMALVDLLDAADIKETDDAARRGTDSLLWYIFSWNLHQQKSALKFVRNSRAKCDKLQILMLSILKMLISILRNEFCYVESMWLRETPEDTKEEEAHLSPYAAAIIAELLRQEQVYDPALSYAKYSIRIDDPAVGVSAFNTYGFLALYLSKYQLAYDIYYSWIHQLLVGELSDVPKAFSEKDFQWRSAHPDAAPFMYGNMAYVCLAISRNLSNDEKSISGFQSAGLENLLKAMESQPGQETLLKTYAEFLYDEGKYTEAIKQLKISEKHTKILSKKMATMQRRLSIQLESLCQEQYWQKTKESYFSEPNADIQSLLDDVSTISSSLGDFKRTNSSKRNTLALSKSFSDIYEICSKLDFQDTENITIARTLVTFVLLCIHNTTFLIRQQLRCKNYIKRNYSLRQYNDELELSSEKIPDEQIAYYTSMANLQFLLNRVYCEKDSPRPIPLADYKNTHEAEQVKQAEKEAKNCFTMMHAHYMNDPNEGLTLLKELSEEINSQEDKPNLVFRKLPPTVFREQLYDGQFVFLKSFTNVIDQLNMWSMYASDRTEGSDSNGCCICIAPETFELMIIDPLDTNPLVQQTNTQNDFHLYKVVYVDNGHIVGDDPLLNEYYQRLKELFVLLNNMLCTHKLKNPLDMDILHSLLQQALAPIMFLFKDSSYRAEQELRIVVTHRKEELDKISKTSQHPPKLFINPYNQVYVEQLILGPKTENPDHWIPYLQYELTKMWASWPKMQYGERKPIVRKSSIAYRD